MIIRRKHGGGSLIGQTRLGEELAQRFAQLGAFKRGGLAAGYEYYIISADILRQVFGQGSAHNAAGAVALHGMADLFGCGQPDAGIAHPVLATYKTQCGCT